MSARRKTVGQNRQGLTQEEVRVAATRMMAAAQAHQSASRWCSDKPDAKPPNIEFFYFSVVSFELVLLSIEQSLRLLLLLHYSIVRSDTNHNLHVLYKAIQNKSGGKEGIRNDIVRKMNGLAQGEGIELFSEEELVTCLRKHDSSYSNFRYFQLNHQARLNQNWEFATRDVQNLHCLALALIHLNMDEMKRQGISAISSMSAVPEAEMTQELKALRDRLSSVHGAEGPTMLLGRK